MIRDSKQTWQEFVSTHNIKTDGKNSCTVCGRKFDEPTDWGFISKTIVSVSWKHEGCSNNGPVRAVVHDPELASMVSELHGLLPSNASVLFDGKKIKIIKDKKKAKKKMAKKSKRKNR
ncbi:MAG TPA: hypothetical protein VFW58_11375 [Trichococcus sp.]|nr:hypothetical protein [Trichococcus sp.]